MKALSIVNVVLSLGLVLGMAYLVGEIRAVSEQTAESEMTAESKMNKLSQDSVAMYEHMGKLQTKMDSLADEVKRSSSSVDIEEAIEKAMRELRAERTSQWEGRRAAFEEGWNLLEPEKQDKATKMMQKGLEDWVELQKKIQSGEVSREDAGKMVRERIQQDMKKFNEPVEEEPAEEAPAEEMPVPGAGAQD